MRQELTVEAGGPAGLAAAGPAIIPAGTVIRRTGPVRIDAGPEFRRSHTITDRILQLQAIVRIKDGCGARYENGSAPFIFVVSVRFQNPIRLVRASRTTISIVGGNARATYNHSFECGSDGAWIIGIQHAVAVSPLNRIRRSIVASWFATESHISVRLTGSKIDQVVRRY